MKSTLSSDCCAKVYESVYKKTKIAIKIVFNCPNFIGCVANGALCGPFLISKGFWIDAGRCVLDGDDPDSDEGKVEKI